MRDAGILAAVQAVKHYEIARYGALIAWVQQLGDKQVAELLRRTLEEEKALEQSFERIAATWIREGVRAA